MRAFVRTVPFALYECIAYYSHILKRLSSYEWLSSLTALAKRIYPVGFSLVKVPVIAQWLALVRSRCGVLGKRNPRKSINTLCYFREEELLSIGVAMTPTGGEGLPACVGVYAVSWACFCFGSGCYTMYSPGRHKPMEVYSSLL